METEDRPFRWVIAFGANLGDPQAQLQRARAALAAQDEERAASALYLSAPMYEEDQPPFYNAVVLVHSDRDGAEMLERIRAIEALEGRARDAARRYGPRSVDLDIIAGWERDGTPVVLDTEALIVPHPRMHERPFVLVPMSEVAPTWVHPLLHEAIATLRGRVGDGDGLQQIAAPGEWR